MPILYIIIPCYNEEEVLPVTCSLFLQELMLLIKNEEISNQSRILFVDDGSCDATWKVIRTLNEQNPYYLGLRLSRNFGHQNAVLSGLMNAMGCCDITITVDCDGQDDIRVMEDMVREYRKGNEVVYGVRSSRDSDTFFKRVTAQGFYRLMQFLGAEVVYNHADYRLISRRALCELADFQEVNLFLRGMVPLVGFQSSCVTYVRTKRMAGKSHYPMRKMAALALDGITSLSVKPLRLILLLGIMSILLGTFGIIWAVSGYFLGRTVSGWSSIICIVCLMGGLQMLCLSVIGEYVGKIYMETKRRPRYIVSEHTPGFSEIKTKTHEE